MDLPAIEKDLEKKSVSKSSDNIDLFLPKYVTVGRFKVRYVRFEKANAPTLVLLNGLPQSIRMWECAMEALTQHFDILAFDIPGFGLSRAEESDMSPRKLADAVIQVLDHFNIKKPHLVGPDVGVPITLALAIQHPDRLESLNIFNGPGHYPPKMSPILMALIKFKTVRWLAKGINKKAVMKTNFQTAIKDGYHHYQPNQRAIDEYYDITHDDQAHRCAITFFGTYPEDLSWIQARHKDLKVPTLITWGKEDPFVPVKNAEYLATQIPNNKLVIFDNASHFSSEDAGKNYQDTLIKWCFQEYKNV